MDIATDALPALFSKAGRNYEETGYEQCWYPLAKSEDLKAGEIIGQDFLDGRVVMYRDSASTARVMTAFCRHMGCDLSLAEVMGDDIRCPFHYWRYGPDGACTKIPSLEDDSKIPKRAKLFSYPTEERLGLLWVFNGEAPLYPVPSFEEHVDMPNTIYRVFENNEDYRADPWWIIATNAFDFQHLRFVHGLNDEFAMLKDIELDVTDHSIGYGNGAITVWGVNCTVGVSPQRNMVGGGTPVGDGRRKGYRVYSANIGDGSDAAIKKAEESIQTIYEHETRIIEDEDVPIVQRINYQTGGFLVQADKQLATYLHYVDKYPRIRMAELIQSAEKRG